MALSRRYSPEWAPGDSALIGLDLSPIIPPGVGLASGSLTIASNTQPPVSVGSDFTVGSVSVSGRAVYVALTGGVSGTDYALTWSVTDTDGNIWNRTALMLCAPTS
jgi:hypothetical protein